MKLGYLNSFFAWWTVCVQFSFLVNPRMHQADHRSVRWVPPLENKQFAQMSWCLEDEGRVGISVFRLIAVE